MARATAAADIPVRDELDEHFVRRGAYIIRHFVAAVLADEWTVCRMSVANFQVIVYAIIVILNFKRLEFECHLILVRNSNFPNALLVWPIVLGVVWTLQDAFFAVNVTAAQSCTRVKEREREQSEMPGEIRGERDKEAGH